MTTMRLNSKVRQYVGLTPGRRVFGRTPKLPIGEAGSPFFRDSMSPAEAPSAKTHNLLPAIYKIRQSLISADFQSQVNATLVRRVRKAKRRIFVSVENGFC